MAPETIKVISSMATREVLAQLLALYQQATSRSAILESAGGVDVARRVQAGEVVDVVVLSASAIDQLIQDGKVLSGSRADLVRSGVSVAVRAGAWRPEISSKEAVKQAVLAAKSLSYSTGPSGAYLRKLFDSWGILEAIKPRIVQAPPGVPVGSLVASGEVELGFQQLSELIDLAGITILGPLPPDIQTITTFSAGIAVTSRQTDAARALLAFLAAPAAAPVKRKSGMEPA